MTVASADSTICCPVCGSIRTRMVPFSKTTTRAFQFPRCTACGLVFAWPRPTDEELRAFYGSGYFRDSSRQTGYTDYFSVGEDNMRNMWPAFCFYTGMNPREPRRMLDVGCASGRFIAEAKKDGWQVKGVDYGEDAVTRAREVYGLDVDLGDITHPSLKEKSFDVITLWHVLEHLIEPLATLRRARELLVPGGKLFIELPSWNSLGRIIKQERWAQPLPPAHINYFTRRSLPDAARRAGFRVLRASTHHVAGFDRLKTNHRLRLVRPAIRATEKCVEMMGLGAYLRVLAEAP